MLAEKGQCHSNDRQEICILHGDNTISLWEDNLGQITGPNCYKNAETYLSGIDKGMEYFKMTKPNFYEKIIELLREHGFEYEPWKAFILASDDYIWPRRTKLTQKQIEHMLGYKIEIVNEE